MSVVGSYVGSDLTDAETLALAVIMKFPRDQWINAINVARIESAGFNRYAHNTNGEDSRGMFQINVAPNANPQYASRDLYDIWTNVETAAEIYHAWGNWGAWYNSAKQLGIL